MWAVLVLSFNMLLQPIYLFIWSQQSPSGFLGHDYFALHLTSAGRIKIWQELHAMQVVIRILELVREVIFSFSLCLVPDGERKVLSGVFHIGIQLPFLLFCRAKSEGWFRVPWICTSVFSERKVCLCLSMLLKLHNLVFFRKVKYHFFAFDEL